MLSSDAQLEICINNILNDFNKDIDEFARTYRENKFPCAAEVKAIRVNVNEESLPSDVINDALNNIMDSFTCLYYSYRMTVMKETWDTLTLLDEHHKSVFSMKKICNIICLSKNPNCYKWAASYLGPFESDDDDERKRGQLPSVTSLGNFSPEDGTFPFYKFPAVLLSRETRLKFGSLFLFDVLLLDDIRSEMLIVDIFDEFMGCAVSSKLSNLIQWTKYSSIILCLPGCSRELGSNCP